MSTNDMSQITVDDMDPRVVHTGAWVVGGTSHEYQSTVSSTSTPGDSLTFSFAGTSVGVFGTIDGTSAGVTTTYALDGGTPAQVVSPAGAGDTYNQSFWKSGAISDANHTLIVTVTKVNTAAGPGEGTIWFDYFVYTSSQHASSSTTVLASTPSATATSTSNNRAKSSKVNIGAIIGGGIAALFFLGLFIAWLIFRRRKTTRKPDFVVDYSSKDAPYDQAPVTEPLITPFPIPGSTTPSTGQYVNSSAPSFPNPHTAPFSQSTAQSNYHTHSASQTTLQSMTSTGLPKGVAASVGSSAITSPAAPNPGSSTLAPSRSTAKRRDRLVVLAYDDDDNDRDPDESSVPPTVTQHVDSGIRTGSVDIARTAPVVELPPVYTPN